MSGGATPAAACPAPPPDLAQRDLPLRVLDVGTQPLYRIHRALHGPIHFNKPGSTRVRFRFDAPNDEYGVLYASPFFDACVAETVIRDRFFGGALPLQIEEREVVSRRLSILKSPAGRLTLVDLTQPLLHLGGNAQILTDPDYTGPNLWSLALQQHPARVDGIFFTSRYANAGSVAVFDHVPLEPVGQPAELASWPAMAAYLDRYDIGLI